MKFKSIDSFINSSLEDKKSKAIFGGEDPVTCTNYVEETHDWNSTGGGCEVFSKDNATRQTADCDC